MLFLSINEILPVVYVLGRNWLNKQILAVFKLKKLFHDGILFKHLNVSQNLYCLFYPDQRLLHV